MGAHQELEQSGFEGVVAFGVGDENSKFIALSVTGDMSVLTGKPYVFQYTLNELVQNCIDKGCASVDVDISYESETGTYRMRVTDDVVHADEEIPAILANLSKDEPEKDTTHKRLNTHGGGLGVPWAKKMFRELGGDLIYSEEDGKVVATATWQKDKYETIGNP